MYHLIINGNQLNEILQHTLRSKIIEFLRFFHIDGVCGFGKFTCFHGNASEPFERCQTFRNEEMRQALEKERKFIAPLATAEATASTTTNTRAVVI